MKVTKDFVVPLKLHEYSYEPFNLLMILRLLLNPLATYLKQGSISRLANPYLKNLFEPKPI